ncbi:MAG: DUF4115 domain-containing protein [Clostridiales bacterium]|nr:DUF4115 domain-containing protein [Clostridiales bacterium]
MEGIGGILRDARERKDATFEQIEEATKIKKRYLLALELEEWDQLPGKVYAKGFLRTYARFLGLDDQSLSDLFELAMAGKDKEQTKEPVKAAPQAEEQPPKARPKKKRREVDLHNKPKIKMIYILCLLSALVLAFCIWAYQTYHQEPIEAEKPPTQHIVLPQPEPKPVVVEEPEPEPVVLTSITLQLTATEACWLRLKDQGEQIYENTMRGGDVLEFAELKEIEIRLGNAGGVVMTLNGLELPLMGKSGQIVTKYFSIADGVMYDDETGEALS